MQKSWFLALALISLSSCQNLWEINPIEPWNTPPLPASGEMDNWEIDEFRSRMKSLTWVTAVVNDSTLGSQLVSRLTALAASASTKVEASLLLIRAYSRVEGVPNATNRVISHLFPELIASGLLNGFNPASSSDTQALRNLVVNMLQTTDTAARTKIINAMVEVHNISATNLSVTLPGIDWYGSASLEELGQVAQLATGAGLVFALYNNTTPANDVTKVIAFLNSAGLVADVTANFVPASLGTALQDLFNAMDKNTNNTNPIYEHMERIGDLLPF